jgi:hypothetical protein
LKLYVFQRSILISLLLFLAFPGSNEALAAQLTLTWTDNSSNEDGLTIERRTGTTGAFTQIATVGSNVTSYIDAGLTDGTTYCYRVTAFNAAGYSPYSNEGCATTAVPSYTLSVAKAGSGSGGVTSNHVGITCGADCSESYLNGSSITLTAAPDTNSTFTGWSGGSCAGTGSCTLNLTSDTSVTASFTAPGSSVSVSDSTVTEGDSGTVSAVFTVAMSAPSTQTVAVSYSTADGTATGGSSCSGSTDYISSSGMVTFLPQETSKSITVEVCGDMFTEPDETFFVNLTSATNATIGAGQGVGTILDGDTSEQTVLFVEPAGQCNGNSPCFSAIQDAIDAAGVGATVIKVAKGTYRENLVVNSSKNFSLEGGWNGNFFSREKDSALTVIDGDVTGDGIGDGPVLAISAGSGAAITVNIEGFTIRNGAGVGFGGGISAWALSSGSITLGLERNIIRDNRVAMLDSAAYGGALFAFAEGLGATVSATLVNNIIHDNASAHSGGGVDAAAADFGAVVLDLINNTISENTASGGGGGLSVHSQNGGSIEAVLINNIIWANTAPVGRDVVIGQSSGSTVVDASFNDIGDLLPESGTYNDRGGNVTVDPLFVNPSGGDFHLRFDSPVIDAGTPEGAPDHDFEGDLRPQYQGYDMGADQTVAPAEMACALSAEIEALLSDPATPVETLSWLRAALASISGACALLNNPDFISAFSQIKKAVYSLERAARTGAPTMSIIQRLSYVVENVTSLEIAEAAAAVCPSHRSVRAAQRNFDQGLVRARASSAIGRFLAAFKKAVKSIPRQVDMTGNFGGTLTVRQAGQSAKIQVTASLAQSDTALTGTFHDSLGRVGNIDATICALVVEELNLDFDGGQAAGSGKANKTANKLTIKLSGADGGVPFTAKGTLTRQ